MALVNGGAAAYRRTKTRVALSSDEVPTVFQPRWPQAFVAYGVAGGRESGADETRTSQLLHGGRRLTFRRRPATDGPAGGSGQAVARGWQHRGDGSDFADEISGQWSFEHFSASCCSRYVAGELDTVGVAARTPRHPCPLKRHKRSLLVLSNGSSTRTMVLRSATPAIPTQLPLTPHCVFVCFRCSDALDGCNAVHFETNKSSRRPMVPAQQSCRTDAVQCPTNKRKQQNGS